MTVLTPTKMPIVPFPRLEKGLITAQLLPWLDVERGELVEGVFIEMPPPGYEHGFTQSNITAVLKLYAQKMKFGRVCNGETGIYTQRDPDTVRGMDAALISYERFKKNLSKQYIDVPPELIVEVLSPSDRWSYLNDKIDEYFEMGVDLVWVVDPRKKTVRVYTSPADMTLYREDDVLTAEPYLPDFSTPVSALFE